MVFVPDRTTATLMPLINQYIRPGSTIISDQWRAYRGIQVAGFSHQTVNHSRNFVDPDTLANTQTVERLWKSKQNSEMCMKINDLSLDIYIYYIITWKNPDG